MESAKGRREDPVVPTVTGEGDAQSLSSFSSALASSPPASALRLSPEVEAIIARVIAQPQHEMTPAEIWAWAQRLAEDVADAPEPYTVASPPASAPPSCWHGHKSRVVGCVSCVLVFDNPRIAIEAVENRLQRRSCWCSNGEKGTCPNCDTRTLLRILKVAPASAPPLATCPHDCRPCKIKEQLIASEQAILRHRPASAPQGDTHDTTNETKDAR